MKLEKLKLKNKFKYKYPGFIFFYSGKQQSIFRTLCPWKLTQAPIPHPGFLNDRERSRHWGIAVLLERHLI